MVLHSYFINTKKNSLIIHEENIKKITTVSVVLIYVIKFHVNFNVHFSFDYFANKLTNMGSFLSHLKHLYELVRLVVVLCQI